MSAWFFRPTVLRISQRGYVLETTTILLEGKAADLVHNNRVRQAYLGG